LCGSEIISPITSRLQLPPTFCACKRNWSEHGNIHSLKRNRLKHENVIKLVAMRHSLRMSSIPISRKLSVSYDKNHENINSSIMIMNNNFIADDESYSEQELDSNKDWKFQY